VTTLPGYIEKVIKNLVAKNSENIKNVIQADKSFMISLLERVDNDSVANIVYLLMKTDAGLLIPVFTEFELNLKSQINQTILDASIPERIKNLTIILIKFYKDVIYKINTNIEYNTCLDFYLKHFDLCIKNLEYLLTLDINNQEACLKSVKNIYLLFYEVLKDILSCSEVESGVLTNNYFEADLNASTNTQTSSSGDNLSDEFKPNKTSDSFLHNKITMQPERVNDTLKLFSDAYLTLFKFAEGVRLQNSTLATMANGNAILRVSEIYLIFLDISLILLLSKNNNFLTTLSENTAILTNFLTAMIAHPNNSFLNIKMIKIFEIILFNPFYDKLKITAIEILSQFFHSNLPNLNFKEIINTEKGCLSYKSLANLNSAYLINLLLFLFNLQFNEETSTSVLFNEIQNYIILYQNITITDLLSKEIQGKEDLKNAGDEEMKTHEKNCNIFL
jgi:hypothetical protein